MNNPSAEACHHEPGRDPTNARPTRPPTDDTGVCGPGERVPEDHTLHLIKALVDEALDRLSPEFDTMYTKIGHPSVPSERLPRPPS